MDPDHEPLIARYLAGERDPALLKRLIGAVAADAELRAELLDELALARMLAEGARPSLDPAPVLAAIALQRDSALEQAVMAGIGGSRRRLPWRRLTAAAVVLLSCLGLTTVALQERQRTVASQPLATLHYVRGVRWPEHLVRPPADGARLVPGGIDLLAGVAEIAIDNGVVLVLEGPARIELSSAMQARLHHGRLSTNVPGSARGFTIATDAMRVIDLGTEVGIDLAHDGQAHVQVYDGAVELALDDAAIARAQARMVAGEARHFDPASGTLHDATFAAGRFIRSGPPRELALDVADLVGGGDGRGAAIWDGIDPATGRTESGTAPGIRPGDRRFHALPEQPFIDGVFVPAGGGEPSTVSSAGHVYRFARSDGRGYDLIRRGAFMIRPPDMGTTVMERSPSTIAGIDHAEFGRSLVGIHANAGITFDLQAIGEAFGRRPTRFSATVANTAPRRVAPVLTGAKGAFDHPGDDPVRWTPLVAPAASSVAGTVLSLQGDGSFLASDAAATDTYIVTGGTALARLTALKLEVLPDPRLPSSGPGTSGHGNFVLTRLSLAVASAHGRRGVGVTGAVADFSQAGWAVGNAVTGDDALGWGIVPETGRAHTAVFFLNPQSLPADAQLEIGLAQLQRQWDHHLIGRFRLSLTDDADPARDLAVGAGSFLVLVDGQLVQRAMVPQAEQSPALLDIPLLPGQRFLTLASSDGGYGNGLQWTTLGDPRLHLEP
jgi:hypothetical protein